MTADWRWTAEDSRDLDEQIRRMRRGASPKPRHGPMRDSVGPKCKKRTCEDCGADISRRGPTATRCEPHAYEHKRQIARQRRASRKENTR